MSAFRVTILGVMSAYIMIASGQALAEEVREVSPSEILALQLPPYQTSFLEEFRLLGGEGKFILRSINQNTSQLLLVVQRLPEKIDPAATAIFLRDNLYLKELQNYLREGNILLITGFPIPRTMYSAFPEGQTAPASNALAIESARMLGTSAKPALVISRVLPYSGFLHEKVHVQQNTTTERQEIAKSLIELRRLVLTSDEQKQLELLTFEFLTEWPAYHAERAYYSDPRNNREIEFDIGVQRAEVSNVDGGKYRRQQLDQLTLKRIFDMKMLAFQDSAEQMRKKGSEIYVSSVCELLKKAIVRLPLFSKPDFYAYTKVCTSN